MSRRAERRGVAWRGALGPLGLGAVLCAAALVLDAEPLWAPGLVLVLVAVLALGWVALGSAGARVAREDPPRRCVEDEPVELRLRAHAGLAPLPGVAIDDPLAGRPLRLRGGERRRTVRLQVRFERRGQRLVAPPRLVVRDPLGLVERAVAAPGDPVSVLVVPRVEPVRVLGAGPAGRALGRRASFAGAAEVELDGLRPMRPGAPASRIHWPAVARGAGLLERRLRPEAESLPLVVLDARVAGEGEPANDALDAAVRATASLARALMDAGGCSVLLPGDRRPVALEPGGRAFEHLRARLALIGPGGPAPALGARAGRASLLVLVLARAATRPPAGLLAAPVAQRILVTPGPPPRGAVLAVAGCAGVAVAGQRITAEAAA